MLSIYCSKVIYAGVKVYHPKLVFSVEFWMVDWGLCLSVVVWDVVILGTDCFLFKIKFIAKYKPEFTTKFAIAQNVC